MSAPLKIENMVTLTCRVSFDILRRRAGRDARPTEYVKHADSHKYCPLGRCGTRTGPYTGGGAKDYLTKTQRITKWRKQKALTYAIFLEELENARKKS